MKRFTQAAATLCLLLCTSTTVFSADLVLNKNNAAEWKIVLPVKSFSITRRAALDLQIYLKKVLDAELEIVKSDETLSGNGFYIGEGPAALAAGVDPGKLPRESFIIKRSGKNIYIAGRDTKGSADSDHWKSAPQSGTWYGVSRFLENNLGVRWFFPGVMGEEYSRLEKLAINDLNITESPKMTYRRMSYLWWKGLPEKHIQEVKDWKRRNGNGWSIVWKASHTWLYDIPAEKYFKDHPEWFALVQGRRKGSAPHGVQLCTTNPGVLDKFAEVITEKSGNEGGTMQSLGPNDGGYHCECKKCTALDVEKLPNGNPVLSDRYVTYCNEVAERVTKKIPEQTFGFYAYSFYSAPPRKTILNPQVKVMHVLNDTNILYYSEKLRNLYLNEKLLPWKKAVGTLFFYTHPAGMGNMALPSAHPKAIKLLYDDLNKAGITGISMNNQECFPAAAINHYLFEKLAWNPELDFDLLYQDALEKCYGKAAAEHIKAYFAVLENNVARYAEKISINMALGSARRFPGLLDYSYIDLYEKGNHHLTKALDAEINGKQRFRVKQLYDNLTYCKDTVDLYFLAKKLMKERSKDRKQILKAVGLAKKREDYLNRLVKDNWLMLSRAARTEKDYYLPLSSKIWNRFLNENENPKIISIPMLEKAPVIDGDITDEVWRDAPQFEISADKDSGDIVKNTSTGKIAYDKKFIYLSIVNNEPLMEKVADTITTHDGNIWEENDIELFFDIENKRKGFRQIMSNTLGTVADFDLQTKGDNPKGWNSDIKVSVKKNNDSWILEAAIPFKKLSKTGTTPKIGEIWGFNACRVSCTGKKRAYSCWNPTYGLFGKPERFGKIVFK
ncbi:MAG: DUF4838 domain-containing protein [Planctomycetota bacterium]|jgi:hypothetical protein